MCVRLRLSVRVRVLRVVNCVCARVYVRVQGSAYVLYYCPSWYFLNLRTSLTHSVSAAVRGAVLCYPILYPVRLGGTLLNMNDES